MAVNHLVGKPVLAIAPIAFGAVSAQTAPASKVTVPPSSDLAQHLGESGLRALSKLSYDQTGMDWLSFLGKATTAGEGTAYANLKPQKMGLDPEFTPADWQDLYQPLAKASLVRLDEETLGLTPFGRSVFQRLESYQPTTNRISASLQALGQEAARIMSSIRTQRSEWESKLCMVESWQRQVEARQNPSGGTPFSIEGLPDNGNTMASNPSASEQEQLAYQRAMLTNQRAQFQFSLDRIDEDRARYVQIFQDPERTRPQLEQLKTLLKKPPTLLQRAISWVYTTIRRLLGLG